MKILTACFFLLAVSYLAHAQDPYADFVVSYVSGTGEGFKTSYDDSSAALGPATTGSDGSILYGISYPAYQTSQIVGVGEGGELTVEFATPITNDPADHADGMDFTIFGNEFFENGAGGTISGAYVHSGLTVWVSQDNVHYYQLVVPNGYGADDSFPTNPIDQGGNPFLPVSPSLSLSSFTGLTPAQALSLYDGSAGGASFSISWAEDANGDPVDLSSISYIQVDGSTGYGYIDAFSRVEAVPEGSNMALVLMGTGGLLCLRRFRKRWRRLGKVPASLAIGAALLFTVGASAQAGSFTLSNIQYWVGSGTNQSALVISWNDGVTPDSLVFGYNWNAFASGADPTVYDMMEAIQSADPLLSFTADPEYDSPDTGDYALYSAFYNLTGQGGPVVGTPSNLGGTENGYAPAGDHYREGWFTGFWGEVIGIGNPYDGGTWNTDIGEGLAVDTLSDDSWYGLSFSTDETNFTIPDPGFPSAVFPVSVPEPSGLCWGAMGLLGCWKWKRRPSRLRPPI